jgi:chorismate lyase/3-hydroxybenzoate synthase
MKATDALRPCVTPCVRAGETTLFRFGLAEVGPGDAGTGLRYLGGDLPGECWFAGRAIESGSAGEIRRSGSGDLLFLALEVGDDPQSDPAAMVESAYRRLLAEAARFDCPHLVRAWNYLPAINDGSGDRERYRRFCVGRGVALDEAGYAEDDLCAGTAIGGDDPRLRIYLLCSRSPGINIENPRQVSAYRYPREYGPRSPSFARATALGGEDGEPALLMISGTASVVGHRTAHDEVGAQLDEIFLNLETLLDEGARAMRRPALGAFHRGSLLRAYVRRPEDWPSVERRVRQRWPEARLCGLRGDICRGNLLVEIEAVTHG